MENIFHHLCWVCNTQQEKLLNVNTGQIKDTKISHMLEYCTQKPLSISNELSEAHTANICYNCLKCLEISYNFLRRYHQSQKDIKIVQDCIIKAREEQQQQQISYEEEMVEYVPIEETNILNEFIICEDEPLKTLEGIEELPEEAKRLACLFCHKSFLTEKALDLHTKIYHKNRM